ncbi:hypothetical protein BD309DRAFT_968065 [Dichomitus squalens]|nr:hypothetical protein BD309DRAFT_968065 [Dichomitus squalens]
MVFSRQGGLFDLIIVVLRHVLWSYYLHHHSVRHPIVSQMPFFSTITVKHFRPSRSSNVVHVEIVAICSASPHCVRARIDLDLYIDSGSWYVLHWSSSSLLPPPSIYHFPASLTQSDFFVDDPRSLLHAFRDPILQEKLCWDSAALIYGMSVVVLLLLSPQLWLLRALYSSSLFISQGQAVFELKKLRRRANVHASLFRLRTAMPFPDRDSSKAIR